MLNVPRDVFVNGSRNMESPMQDRPTGDKAQLVGGRFAAASPNFGLSAGVLTAGAHT